MFFYPIFFFFFFSLSIIIFWFFVYVLDGVFLLGTFDSPDNDISIKSFCPYFRRGTNQN